MLNILSLTRKLQFTANSQAKLAAEVFPFNLSMTLLDRVLHCILYASVAWWYPSF